MVRTCVLRVVLAGVWAAAGAAAGADPGDGPPFDPAAVKAAVEGLTSPDYRAREAASRVIDRAGDRALAVVKDELKKPHPAEAARRLEVLAERLTVARLKAPRRVTLKADKTPLDEALKTITAQTGYTFKLNGTGNEFQDAPPKRPVTVDLRGVPFLEAMDLLCDANDLAHFNRDDDGVLTVNATNAVDPVKAYAGPFRVTVTGVGRSNSLQLAGVARRAPPLRRGDQLTVQLAVESEPKAPMLSLDKVEVVSAADDRGARVQPPAQNDDDQIERQFYSHGRGNGKTFTQNCNVPLGQYDRAAQSLKHLTLKVSVTVLAETRVAAEVTDLTKAKGAKLAGRDVAVDVTGYATANGMTTVEMTARHSGPGPADPDRHGGWAYQLVQRLQLVDSTGTAQPVMDTDVNDAGATATLCVVFRTPARNKSAKAALQLVEWDARSQDVTVTLKDVPLP